MEGQLRIPPLPAAPAHAPRLAPREVVELQLALLAEDDVEGRDDEQVALELRDDLVAHAVAQVELGRARGPGGRVALGLGCRSGAASLACAP